MVSLLILLTGLVSLHVYSPRNEMMSRDLGYLQVQLFSTDEYGSGEISAEEHLDLCLDSKQTFLPEKCPGRLNKPLPVVYINRFTPNPLLADLPPPPWES